MKMGGAQSKGDKNKARKQGNFNYIFFVSTAKHAANGLGGASLKL